MAEAIAKVMGGQVWAGDVSPELIEPADEYGMPKEQLPADVAKQLKALGYGADGDILPTIRSVELEGEE